MNVIAIAKCVKRALSYLNINKQWVSDVEHFLVTVFLSLLTFFNDSKVLLIQKARRFEAIVMRWNTLAIVTFLSFGEIKRLIFYSILLNCTHLTFLFEKVAHSSLLFGHEGHFKEFLFPLSSDRDGVLLNLLVVNRISLAVGVFDHLLNVMLIQCIPHIVHVALTAESAFWVVWGEILCHAC